MKLEIKLLHWISKLLLDNWISELNIQTLDIQTLDTYKH